MNARLLVAACFVVAVATVTVPTAHAAALPDEEKVAVETIRRYSNAWMGLEIEPVVELTHPAVILRIGGKDKYRSVLREGFAQFEGWGFRDGRETLGTPSEMFVNGTTRLIGVPAIRVTKGTGRVGFAYVAASYDSGKTWSVLSLACTDEQWLRGIAPGYDGKPDILGMSNPEIAKSVTEANFDEVLFLKGPKGAKLLSK